MRWLSLWACLFVWMPVWLLVARLWAWPWPVARARLGLGPVVARWGTFELGVLPLGAFLERTPDEGGTVHPWPARLIVGSHGVVGGIAGIGTWATGGPTLWTALWPWPGVGPVWLALGDAAVSAPVATSAQLGLALAVLNVALGGLQAGLTALTPPPSTPPA